jgi:hypothetical protein
LSIRFELVYLFISFWTQSLLIKKVLHLKILSFVASTRNLFKPSAHFRSLKTNFHD